MEKAIINSNSQNEEIQNKVFRLTFSLIFFIALIISCSNQTNSNQITKTIQHSDKNKDIESKIDTSFLLKFTTGVRSVLEDSKGNIWFGSHQEGVCLFDGKKLTYFTVKDGLSNNQIRSIYEDSNRTIWFEGGEGISSFDGKRIITHHIKNYIFKNDWQTGKNDLWFKGDEGIGYKCS